MVMGSTYFFIIFLPKVTACLTRIGTEYHHKVPPTPQRIKGAQKLLISLDISGINFARNNVTAL